MRAAAAASRPQVKLAPAGYERELLSFVSELRLQLASQQKQINELARHTTGEINRLWAALAQGSAVGTITTTTLPVRQRSLSRSLPVGTGRAAVIGAAVLGGGGTDGPAEFAGLAPDSSAILQQIYAMDASQNELGARLAALEARRNGGGEGHSAPPPPSAPAPAVATQSPPPSRRTEGTITTPVVAESTASKAPDELSAPWRQQAAAAAAAGDDDGAGALGPRAAPAKFESAHKPRVSSPLSPERGGSKARRVTVQEKPLPPSFDVELTRRLRDKQTEVNAAAFADVPMETIRHRHAEQIEGEMRREGWRREPAAEPAAEPRAEAAAEVAARPSEEPDVPPLGLAASGVGVSPELEYSPVRVGSESEDAEEDAEEDEEVAAGAQHSAATSLQAGVRGRQSRRRGRQQS